MVEKGGNVMIYKISLKKLIVFAVLMVVMLTSTKVFADSSLTNRRRLSGDNRYDTSIQIALDGWKQSDYAILTCGENFPDALSAAPLAKKYNAPILLTQKDSLPTQTINVLQQLKVKNVFVIGGTGVISTEVDTQLTSMGIYSTRLFGKDRYETDIKVAERLDNVKEIAIVTGEDYSDALAIAPIAQIKNMPIILIQHNAVPEIVKDYISSHNISKTYLVGGGSSIDYSILNEFSNVEEIDGQDKYERNLAIINKFKKDLNLSSIYVASGENFADALSGVALAGKNSNPMLLVGTNIDQQQCFLNDNCTSTSNIIILGGTAVVKDDLTTPIKTYSVNEVVAMFRDAITNKQPSKIQQFIPCYGTYIGRNFISGNGTRGKKVLFNISKEQFNSIEFPVENETPISLSWSFSKIDSSTPFINTNKSLGIPNRIYVSEYIDYFLKEGLGDADCRVVVYNDGFIIEQYPNSEYGTGSYAVFQKIDNFYYFTNFVDIR